MQRSTRRALGVILAAAVLQLTAVLVYWAFERTRGPRSARGFEYDALDPPEALAPIVFEDSAGNRVPLSSFTHRPVLLHFWATWCAPCRTELPSLLASVEKASESSPVLVLVSVDENWDVIRHFFDGEVPAQVVRDAKRTALEDRRVDLLPETLVLQPPGLAVARIRGAREWGTDEARTALAKLTRPGT